MPFKEQTMSGQRQDLVNEILTGDLSIAAVCRKYGVSRPTAYLWLGRHTAGKSMESLSKRPKSSSIKTKAEVEQLILDERGHRPHWGARKLKGHIERTKHIKLPAVSTVHSILQRNDQITEAASQAATHYVRFVREKPNSLWQVDFKGYIFLSTRERCYPLVVVDDFSRFDLCIKALPGETESPVRREFLLLFAEYGLPDDVLSDNGNPWGAKSTSGHTKFEVFLMDYGILPIHTRAYRPQTQGKVERFNKSLKYDLIERKSAFTDFADAQAHFDAYRKEYNELRPHEALKDAVPSDVYLKSERAMPSKIYEWEYPSDYKVRKVVNGWIKIYGKRFYFSDGLHGKRVGLKHSVESDTLDIVYRNFIVGKYDLHHKEIVTRKIKRVKSYGLSGDRNG